MSTNMHKPECKTFETKVESDCDCAEVIHRRQRSLFDRTLTKEEVDTLLGPEGEGIEFDSEVWKEMQRKSCGESTTE